MSVHSLDTLAIAGKLKAAGFSDQQAEAMTFVLRDASDAGMSGAATKSDLASVKSELQTEIQFVRKELQTVRTELKNDLSALGLTFEARIESAKSETIKWVVSAIGFQTIVLVGAVVAMSRLFQP